MIDIGITFAVDPVSIRNRTSWPFTRMFVYHRLSLALFSDSSESSVKDSQTSFGGFDMQIEAKWFFLPQLAHVAPNALHWLLDGAWVQSQFAETRFAKL